MEPSFTPTKPPAKKLGVVALSVALERDIKHQNIALLFPKFRHKTQRD